MGKRMFRIMHFVVAIIAIVVVLYNICYLIVIKYGTLDIETRKFNMLISGSVGIDPEMELLQALQWYRNWDHLFLTDNFKNKFKKRQNILHDVDKLGNMSLVEGYEFDSEKEIIGISGFKRKTVFEMLNPDYIEIYSTYYFRYKVDDNGYLDDVELVGQQDFDAETGFPIGDDREEYHTIS